jgi:hypothetical protein
MTTKLAIATLCTLVSGAARGGPPTAPPAADLCKVPNNQITGPNTHGHALPLLRGDPAHPKVACLASWEVLSPDNRPLPVQACFEGKLLQLPSSSVCGHDKAPLWVERRWVVTSADKTVVLASAKTSCQELDTSTVAATRDFHPECTASKTSAPAADRAAQSSTSSAAAPPPVPIAR